MGMRWLRAVKMPVRHAGPVAAGLLLAVLAAFGGLFAYASLGRLPTGLTVSGWAVGGMPYAAFDAALTARTESLAKTPLQLRTSAYGLPPLQTTYGQLGVQTSAAELARSWRGCSTARRGSAPGSAGGCAAPRWSCA